MQEAAQLLSGADFPKTMLAACLKGIDGKAIAERARVVNLTPYDGHLARQVLHYQWIQNGMRLSCVSLSSDLTAAQHTEQVLALEMLQDLYCWSCHIHLMQFSLLPELCSVNCSIEEAAWLGSPGAMSTPLEELLAHYGFRQDRLEIKPA